MHAMPNALRTTSQTLPAVSFDTTTSLLMLPMLARNNLRDEFTTNGTGIPEWTTLPLVWSLKIF